MHVGILKESPTSLADFDLAESGMVDGHVLRLALDSFSTFKLDWFRVSALYMSRR